MATPAQLRLTRRGRLVGLLILAAVMITAFGLGRASAGPDLPRSHAASVVVHSGESLWSIAARELPGVDTRDAVAQIEKLNQLDGGSIDAGQTLRLP